MTERPKPTNVLEALRAVSAAIDHITKDRESKSAGKFAYRGIEDVLEACHDPFIEFGIVVAPQVMNAESVLRTIPNEDGTIRRVEYEAQILVNYRVYGPGGPADFIDCPIFATGISATALGSGSAMSYAYKSLMFQLLCIPTAAAEDNEAAPAPERTAVRQAAPREVQEGHGADSPRWLAAREKLLAMGDERRPVVDAMIDVGLFGADRLPKLPFSAEDMAKVERGIETAVSGDERAETMVPGPEIEDPSPAHAEHAVETILLALGVDEVPDEVDPAFWYLADFKDADEVDWKAAARMLRTTQKAILDDARKLATAMLEMQPPVAVEMPDRLDDIRGDLAVELRSLLIKDAAGEPW